MSVTISKQEHQNDPDKFERLFQLGITYIQQLGGKVWTDYNTHDPGVTILEQVCFALTDIIYRSDFAVCDLLADDYGRIDYPNYGLARPDEVLSAPPQIPSEYQDFIVRTTPQLEQVWFQSSEQYPHLGLYQISGLLQRFFRRQQHALQTKDEDSNPEKNDPTIQSILQTYHQIRGLGEDIEEVNVIGETCIHLAATIEISNDGVDANQIAANIYYQCAHWLRQRTNGDLSELEDLILSSANIQQVRGIRFEAETHPDEPIVAISEIPEYASLIMPEADSDIRLEVVQNQHLVALDVADVVIQIEQQLQQQTIQRQHLTTAMPLPSGHHRDLSSYDSIQTLFPRNYQLATKTNTGYDPKSQAQRHQLRSYLLLFDQLMANFCEDLTKLPELFSTSLSQPTSYHVHTLTPQEFNDINSHYPVDAKSKLQALQSEFDNFPERKGRIYDYLIALYGEQYPDTLHRAFNPYCREPDIDWLLLEHKQRFIRNIAAISNQRGLGNNLLNPSHTGGYQQRLSILLGMNALKNGDEGTNLNISRYLLNIVSDEDYLSSNMGQKAVFELKETVLPNLETLPESQEKISLSTQQKRQIRASVYALDAQTLPESLLQFGIDNQRYRILKRARTGDYRLFFDIGTNEEKHWLYIGRYNHKQKLIRFCHWLQAWLVEINQQTETLHVVEPITLRHPESDIESLANQVYVVIPGFTARHRSPLFRQQVAQLIRTNTPAHLCVHLMWLNFNAFSEFEDLYNAWRKQKALTIQLNSNEDKQQCDEMAKNLLTFLQKPDAAQEALIL
ncbi:hypothetical protein BA893_07470 [Vibrio natriegens]|uniref:hypothetical protein n=1 Tax=Vibrio natriegens TaxID=691 RepID=UPI0008046BAC|nr:hypothetical protein [Vibrio natriegens]ANQ21515.1 hypothetical protein BA893_07470 [Vibrio natriegens]